MTIRSRRGDEDRALAREALRQAPGSEDTRLSRLVDSVPALMAEARRRRHAPGRLGFDTALAATLRRAIPRLAAATAVILVLVSAALLGDRGETVVGATGFDSIVLTGGENVGTGDDLFAAIVNVEQLNE
jgi:hypothetical protein